MNVTVAKRFVDSLGGLIRTMGLTTPRFVRCIKSNAGKLPDTFESPNVLRQLKYAGVIEALRIRRSGYPNRLAFKDFLDRYFQLVGPSGTRLLRDEASHSDTEWRAHVETLMNHELVRAAVRDGGIQLGKTKAFLRADVLHTLDGVRNRFLNATVLKMQKGMRGGLQVQRFKRLKASALAMQKLTRGLLARRQHASMVQELQAHIARLRAAEKQAKAEAREREILERQREEEARQRSEGEALLKGAQDRLQALRVLEDEKGVRLEEDDEEIWQVLDEASAAISASVAEFTVSSERFLEASKAAVVLVDRAEVACRKELAHREQVEADRVRRVADAERRQIEEDKRRRLQEQKMMAREEELSWAYAAALLEAERQREAAERAAMAREESALRGFLAEVERLERRREAAELQAMRAEEHRQHVMENEVLRRRAVEKARQLRDDALRQSRELQQMRQEEQRQRWYEAERTRVMAIENRRRREMELKREAAELAAMRREEQLQVDVRRAQKRKYVEGLIRWKALEQQRERWELDKMRQVELVQRKEEHALRIALMDERVSERERMLMQAEDAASRIFNLSLSMRLRMSRIAELQAGQDGHEAKEREDGMSILRKLGESLAAQNHGMKQGMHMRQAVNKRLDRLRQAKDAQSPEKIRQARAGRVEMSHMQLEDQRSAALMDQRARGRGGRPPPVPMGVMGHEMVPHSHAGMNGGVHGGGVWGGGRWD